MIKKKKFETMRVRFYLDLLVYYTWIIFHAIWEITVTLTCSVLLVMDTVLSNDVHGFKATKVLIFFNKLIISFILTA